jgi:hypothetical protein
VGGACGPVEGSGKPTIVRSGSRVWPGAPLGTPPWGMPVWLVVELVMDRGDELKAGALKGTGLSDNRLIGAGGVRGGAPRGGERANGAPPGRIAVRRLPDCEVRRAR